MDTLEAYRPIIKRVIQEYAAFLPAYDNVRAEIVFDDEHGHYFLFYTGWDGKKRVNGSAIHIDIIGEKVWVQHDGTKDGVVDALLDAGIPQDKIVLGFQHPQMRPYGEFAAA